MGRNFILKHPVNIIVLLVLSQVLPFPGKRFSASSQKISKKLNILVLDVTFTITSIIIVIN